MNLNRLYTPVLLVIKLFKSTVQLMFKFTTRIVFSRVLFDIIRGPSQTHVPHTSEQIAHKGLVHTSPDCV